MFTHNVFRIIAIVRAVDWGRDCLVGQAVGTKGPPRIFLDFFLPVYKPIGFKVLLDKLESLGSYQRAL